MLISEEDRKRLGTPAPALQAILQTDPFPDFTPENTRQQRADHLKTKRHLYPIPGPIPDQVRETHIQIPARDGSQIPAITYRPLTSSPGQSPLIVMIHEGGWSMGDLSDEEMNCRLFARDLGAVCVNVDYRLAPEHVFPTGVNDCWDVIQWCSRTASIDSEILPCDPSLGFVVGGSSAGGNLAAVMAQLSRDEALSPPITGQYLSVPALLSHGVVPEKWRAEFRSRDENLSDPVLKGGLSERTVEPLMQMIKPDMSSPLFNPGVRSDLKGLAPAFFQIGGLDPLRDEGLIYEAMLKENGVATKLNVYDGYGHMFWTNWPTLEGSKEFVRDTLEGVRWLLGVGKSSPRLLQDMK